ncbi:MAG: MarR family transcriptional regulator [Rhodospirillaceae bacterium]|nr:MarR family transcriptional regulator [Rhodospirillaceae bacterium]
MPDPELPQRIEAVRRFTRFYTRKLGVLHEGLLGSPYSLTEARVIYELAHRETATATELAQELELDAGYLSRLLKRLEGQDLIQRQTADADARQNIVSLTAAGERAFALINAGSRRQVGGMLEPLSVEDQTRLVAAMREVETLLGSAPDRRVPYILRPHQPGDMGWVVQSHALLYTGEYGWDDTFEALVAEIVSTFLKTFDARRERCWIAEMDGTPVGSVFIVRKSDEVAKLRLLLVDARARGLGIGKRLVEECVRFSRARGYSRMTLWTNDILTAARHIYEQAGFRLVKEEPHHSFGHDLVGQDWELEL